MFVQKVPHIKDQFLTQERASMELESGQIAVGWYTNEQDSHPRPSPASLLYTLTRIMSLYCPWWAATCAILWTATFMI